jgi:UPF0288 family protein (methanogenesis marker protein 3)
MLSRYIAPTARCSKRTVGGLTVHMVHELVSVYGIEPLGPKASGLQPESYPTKKHAQETMGLEGIEPSAVHHT